MSKRSRSGVFLFGLALAAMVPQEATAQAPRDRATRGMISQAMESYQALEIEDATNRLQLALRGCSNGNCSPQVTARVYMSLGIVAVMGQQDTAAGVEFMVQALREDANAEPDQLVVTPEITTAFNDARRRAAGGGTSPPPRQNPRNNPPPPPPSSDGGALLHTPPSEQLDNTALPVYVETSGISPEHVYLYFKGNGMVQFRRLDMRRMAAGYGAEIPCGQVIQPSIEYYVTALDANQNTVGSVGSENSPVRVNIVTRRTQPAPSLPGAMPPQRCTESECPPGMSGPQCSGSGGGERGNGGPGDPCTSDNACGVGLHCSEGSCVFGDPPDRSGGGGATGPSGRSPRFSIDVGGGLGAAFLSGRPSYAEARFAVDPATMMRTGAIVCTPYVCSDNIDPGFSPTYWLGLVLRYNLTNRIGLGGGLRFQFDTADTSVRAQTLSNILLFARAYYAFTPQGFAPQGLVAAVFVGGGGGQIQPKPALPARETRPSAHVVSGLGNAHLGVRVEQGLRNGFHFAAELTLQFQFPTFLFDADMAAYVGFHF